MITARSMFQKRKCNVEGKWTLTIYNNKKRDYKESKAYAIKYKGTIQFNSAGSILISKTGRYKFQRIDYIDFGTSVGFMQLGWQLIPSLWGPGQSVFLFSN